MSHDLSGPSAEACPACNGRGFILGGLEPSDQRALLAALLKNVRFRMEPRCPGHMCQTEQWLLIEIAGDHPLVWDKLAEYKLCEGDFQYDGD